MTRQLTIKPVHTSHSCAFFPPSLEVITNHINQNFSTTKMH